MRNGLLIVFVLTAIASRAQVQNLTLASDPWPPFTNVSEEQAFALDIVREGLNRSGITMQTEILQFEEVLSKIQDGTYDGSAALWKTDERSEYLLFSIPYLHNQLVLVGPKGADVSAEAINELRGKRIAIVGTYAYGEEVINEENVSFIAGRNDQENLEKLLNGKVDYMLADALLVQYIQAHQKDEAAKYLSIGKNTLIKRSLHFAIRKDIQGAEQIISHFNDAVVSMVADGYYNTILQINWIRADVDGDGSMEWVGRGQSGSQAPTSSYSIFFQNNQIKENDKYYIDGKMYNGWDNVPKEYKAAPQTAEDLNRSSVLRLRF